MSELRVNKVTPRSGTTVTIGDSGEHLALAGNIGLGGATPTTSGTGITFPATASASTNANTLDDYEEGTFTPVLTGSTSGTFNGEGSYVKIGTLVYVGMKFIAITTANKPIGNYTITGLPFTSKATTPDLYVFSISLTRPSFNTSKIPSAGLADNSTTVSLVEMTSNDVGTNITDANFVNALNMFFRVSGSYISS